MVGTGRIPWKVEKKINKSFIVGNCIIKTTKKRKNVKHTSMLSTKIIVSSSLKSDGIRRKAKTNPMSEIEIKQK